MVNSTKVKGKIAEKGFTKASFAEHLGISRNTLNTYLDDYKRIPYSILAEMANTLCDTQEEAVQIFFTNNLR